MADRERTRVAREQLGVRVSPGTMDLLDALQKHFAEKAGLIEPVSQSKTVEIIVKRVAEAEGVHLPKGKR